MAPSPTSDAQDQVIGKIASLFEETLSQTPPQNIIELWREHVEIRRILNEVTGIQAKIGDTDERLSKATRDTDAIKAFLAWSDSVGIARNNVTIAKTEKCGLSLQATGPIPKDHIVAKVPRHAMITFDMAKKSAMLRKAFERDPIIRGMENVGLALFVACQWLSKEKTKWFSYISVLPNSFPTPLFYTEQQLLNLKPSPIFEEALMFYRTIARQFCYFLLAVAKNKLYEDAQKTREGRQMEVPIFYNTPFTIANFTTRLYFWAVGIVTTRVNMVPSETAIGDDGKPAIIPALIPVLDMANHENIGVEDPSEDLVCFAPDEEAAVVTSHRDVDAGQEVTIFYGLRSKGEHLLHNGFVPVHHGKYDVLKLKFGIPKTDKQLNARMELIQKFVPDVRVASNIFHVDLYDVQYPDQPFPTDLLTFATVFVATDLTEASVKTIEMRKKGLDFLRTRFTLLRRSYEGSFDESKVSETGIEGDAARLKAAEVRILGIALAHCDVLEKTL